MSDYQFLPASDGTGDAALMHITEDRIVDATTLTVDSVSNVPTHFIGTTGTLLASGFIDPSTEMNFTGHLDGGALAIDSIEPGSTDAGNVSGQVVVIKPTTGWANRVAQFIMNASDLGTPEDITVETLDVASTMEVHGALTADGGIDVTAGTVQVPAGSLLKAGLEKPHYGSLFFSLDGGTVFSNSEIDVPFDDYDATNGVGIIAHTGTNAYLEITRAGNYDIDFRFTCIDVPATDFICWIFVSPDSGATWYSFRRQDQALGVGQGDTFSMKGLPLPDGAYVKVQHYNGGGATRFGTQNVGGSSVQFKRQFYESLTVAEVR